MSYYTGPRYNGSWLYYEFLVNPCDLFTRILRVASLSQPRKSDSKVFLKNTDKIDEIEGYLSTTEREKVRAVGMYLRRYFV